MKIRYLYHNLFSNEKLIKTLNSVLDLEIVTTDKIPFSQVVLCHPFDNRLPRWLENKKHNQTFIAVISSRELRRKKVWEKLTPEIDGYILEKMSPSRIEKEVEKIISQNRYDQKLTAKESSMLMDTQKISLLMHINQSISERKPLPDLFSEIMEKSKYLLEAEASSLLIYDPDDQSLHFKVAMGDKGEMIKKFSVQIGQGIAGWVAENKKPVNIEDCYDDPRFDSSYDKKTNFRTRAMLCVPLLKNEQLIGVLQVINKKDGGIFSAEDLMLLETMASQCAIAIDNDRLTKMEISAKTMEQELETARQIQLKALPERIPEIREIDIAAVLNPAKQVGGDYYHIFNLDENISLWVIADVSGKGVPAALIVSTLHAAIQTYLSVGFEKPDLISLVDSVNKVLIDNTTPDKYATAWFGMYHAGESRLESVNAGHNPPYIFKRDEDKPLELTEGGVFLGAYPLPYDKEIVNLNRGDVLVLFTDGVTEAWNEKEEDYEEWRLIKTVSAIKEKKAEEILRAVEKDVEKHVNGAPQSDDFTALVICKE
jgi:sigma-B regulation protein RsbU (phosphoserine phosphatase)